MSAAPCFLMAGGGTGGHVYPLIAVAEALLRERAGLRVVFVGTARGMEAQVVPARGFELRLMEVLPLRGGGVGGALRGLGQAARSIPAGRALVRELAPVAVFSVGGYAAGPVSLAARLAGVPVALLEPNAVIGLANRLTAPFVRRAYTAFPEPEPTFPRGAVLRAGVPLRAGFEPVPLTPRPGPLRVLVLGGSQGARALNEAVPEALAGLAGQVVVVHQCGRSHEASVRERYAALGGGLAARVEPFIDDMPAALAAADLVVSRSGASAVAEICAVGRPSILVPYPFAAGQHQLANARSLEGAGAAVCVESAAATAERLRAEVSALVQDRARLAAMARAAAAVGKPHAARDIALDLLALGGVSVAAPVHAPATPPQAGSPAPEIPATPPQAGSPAPETPATPPQAGSPATPTSAEVR